MFQSFIQHFIKPVHAHCDGPCGHYETDTLQHSAQTCQKLMIKINDLPDEAGINRQTYVRLVALKEEHAQICKQQLYILWSDYFKPAHYAQYPDLMQQLQQAATQCSLVKQTLDLEAVERLIMQIDAINVTFLATQAS